MRLSSSRLKIFSCIPRCLPVQTSEIRHGELRRLGILPCNQTFQDLFYGCGRCGFLCCHCDAFWLRQICRNVAWVRLPGRSMDILQPSVVISLLFWDSSHGLNTCSSMSMRSVVFARSPLSTTSTPTCVECAFGGQRTHQSSATQLSGAYPSNAGRLCDCRAAHRCGRVEMIGTMLDQPSQQRTSRLQHGSRLLFQEIFEGPRKSVHRLKSTFDLSVALTLALWRCFRHNLAVPTIIDSVTEGNDAEHLI